MSIYPLCKELINISRDDVFTETDQKRCRFQMVLSFVKGSAKAKVFLYQNIIIIAFFGDKEFADFNLKKIDNPNGVGKVNEEVFHYVGNIWNSIRGLLTSPDNVGKKVYLTGSGTGAAMAVVAATFMNNVSRFKRLITFNQPRVGNRLFNKSITIPWARVSEYTRPHLDSVAILKGYRMGGKAA